MGREGGNEAFEAIGGEGRDSKEAAGQNYMSMLLLQVAELFLGVPGTSAKYMPVSRQVTSVLLLNQR